MLILEISQDNLTNSPNIVNVTKYNNVNNKTSFIYVLSQIHWQACNAQK